MNKLSDNFTLRELTKSATANRLKINNTPNEQEVQKLTQLAQTILQPIRDRYGKPIVVTSGFRCEKLNKAVGGVKNSQHVLGEAADITSLSDSITDNKALFNLIVQMLKDKEIKVGQLIDEYGYNWIHISLPRSNKVNNQIIHKK